MAEKPLADLLIENIETKDRGINLGRGFIFTGNLFLYDE